MKKIKIGLALGGGGVRGFAHIGVIHTIEKELPDVEIKYLAGTSAGSVVASLYATGISSKELYKIGKKINWLTDVVSIKKSFTSLIIPKKKSGLLDSSSLSKMINGYIKHARFSNLDRKLAIITTDIINRQEIVFTSSDMKKKLMRIEKNKKNQKVNWPIVTRDFIYDYDNIGKAVQASCSIPGLFSGVEIYGRMLQDGGAVNQIPVDIVRAMGADIVIGVSMGISEFSNKIRVPFNSFSNAIDIGAREAISRSLAKADIGFELENISSTKILKIGDYNKFLEWGTREMLKYIPKLKKLIRKKRFFF